jgi:hypothetical protein
VPAYSLIQCQYRTYDLYTQRHLSRPQSHCQKVHNVGLDHQGFHKVMSIIHRAISTHIVGCAGFSNKQAKTGAVTLIQRFGSALNLNIHFHMLFLEGAISENPWGGTTFTRIKAPSHDDMVTLVHTISHRIARYLEKAGLVVRDMDNTYLNLPIDDEDSLLQLQGASVSYRIALGPQQGQKVFTLQTLPASSDGEYGQLANTSGFSLHAGVFANALEPDKLERLCRYISRPAISEQRLSMTQHGQVRYELKTPYRDGTTGNRRAIYSSRQSILLAN